jgi:hypothetical protein
VSQPRIFGGAGWAFQGPGTPITPSLPESATVIVWEVGSAFTWWAEAAGTEPSTVAATAANNTATRDAVDLMGRCPSVPHYTELPGIVDRP